MKACEVRRKARWRAEKKIADLRDDRAKSELIERWNSFVDGDFARHDALLAAERGLQAIHAAEISCRHFADSAALSTDCISKKNKTE